MIRWVLFDWGGTLMSEDGPLDIPMALWPEVRAIEGAHEALEALAPRHGIGLATNASVSRRNMIEIALGRAGLRELVSEIFCYTEMGVRKDNPAFWFRVLARLGVDAAEVAVVGDTLAQDVIAPRECGIFSIWFNAGGLQHEDARGYPMVTWLPDVVDLIESVD
jgi:putative hydrolase of the HAD superfamily